ncbi:MAG: hypothetical protein V1706_06190 [Pseudomonadota bacterium]
MAERAAQIPRLMILSQPHAIDRFTTLLQAGIIIGINYPLAVGDFLASLPGFTPLYIAERVETIFLNGLPVDDLTTKITGSNPVLAISAAMPGLAGAIFRKNSFHAALRTTAARGDDDYLRNSKKIAVLLKLFNMVARERGGELLAKGCLLKTDTLRKFIAYRPQLLAEMVDCRYNDRTINTKELQNYLGQSDTVFLRIEENHDNNR